MSNALLAGVSGLQANQTMLDVAGNNLANTNTYGFKSSRVSFGELLSQTIREATQSTDQMGGTNPAQVGSGVRVASVDRNMGQGNLVNTGQVLDMAIQGGGYFVLNTGQSDVYTRVGAFAVDAQNYLVDPATGFRVQRIGSEGVAEGFQDPASRNIRVPYDVALPAKATETISFTGNLAAARESATTNLLSSGMQFTEGGAVVSTSTQLADMDQASGLAAGDTIRLIGTTRAGTAVNTVVTLTATTTVGDLTDAITAAFPGSRASISNGEIRLTDTETGYSMADLRLEYAGGGSLELPLSFNVLEAGGQDVWTTNTEVYDSLGTSHQASVAFVRSDQANTWDIVLMDITGEARFDDRRVRGVTFGRDGSFGGMGGASPDTQAFSVTFQFDPGNVRQINLNLGTVGEFNGLTQFGADSSTVAPAGQDGYGAGYLSSLSVSSDGTLVGMFTNGLGRDIAALPLATFQNPAALMSIGGGYFTASANSGDPVLTKALSRGAGSVNGASLEQSNVDMASEFVGLIQAQNGYQANARTIRVANDMLQQLTTLIR
jgi:flagellar hook protein FlgE